MDEVCFAREKVDGPDRVDGEATAPPVVFLGAASNGGLSQKLQGHCHIGEEIETAAEEGQAETELITWFESASVFNRWTHGVRTWDVAATRSLIAQWSHQATDRAGIDQGAVRTRQCLFVDAETAPERLK